MQLYNLSKYELINEQTTATFWSHMYQQTNTITDARKKNLMNYEHLCKYCGPKPHNMLADLAEQMQYKEEKHTEILFGNNSTFLNIYS